MKQRTERLLAGAIVAASALLGLVYSVVTPVFEASDEKWHYPMVKTVADNWALPVQETGVAAPWRQEGSQAPLYYILAAAATFWIDTSDMETVRHLNPHVDAGASPDGNVNLVVHNPALERFPWRGTVLAVRLIRFLSVAMGAAAVWFTYLIAREVLPGQPALALGAAALHAFTPMAIFISGSVNNDNLAILLGSLGLWMSIRMVRLAGQEPGSAGERRACKGCGRLVRSYLPLGIVLGLAALAKSQMLALAPIAALVVIVRAVRRRSWREFLAGGSTTALALLLVAGWWYLRNLRLYGDLTGLQVFIEILGKREVPADLAQLWRERFSFLAGYWGNFGGLNVPMAAWVYPVLNGIIVFAGAGLILAAMRSLVRGAGAGERSFEPWAVGLALLWAVLVLIPWFLWARITWSSQGRLVFYALSVWSLLMAVGLAGWFPRRLGRWAVAAFAFFLLGLAIAAPFAWIAPAYALPEPLGEGQAAAIPSPLEVDFGGVMRLLGYELEAEVVEPGGELGVTLYWQALAPTDRDHVVFVHLLGEGELIVAQRDTYPGLGLLSTTWLEPGFRWADRTVLRVPGTAYAPDEAQIEVGLTDGLSGERLASEDGGDNVRFGRVEIQSRPGDVPNPISVNFGDRMALVGYELDRRVARPGQEVALTLYWRALQPMEENYTVSAQFVDAAQVKAAQHDSGPAGGAAPTSTWAQGQVVIDTHLLVVSDVPAGVYDVQVVVYVLEAGEFVHLPVVSAAGEMLASRQILTRVRVGH